jgi:molybdate transport system substrate-binding protein
VSGRLAATRASAAGLALAVLVGAWPAQAEDSAREGELLILAASSLREVLEDLARRFATSYPRCQVRLSVAGSQALRAQIERGVPADLFISADLAQMQHVQRQGLVETPVVVARNRPVLVVSPTSAVRTFAELPQVKRLVIGAPEVPVGAYTLELLRAAEQRFGPAFRAAVDEHIVSRELNVRHMLVRVLLGEADAGIVYASDAASAGDKVRLVPIPAELNVTAQYPAALLRTARKPELARAFLGLLGSSEGQQRLGAAGFLPAQAEVSR